MKRKLKYRGSKTLPKTITAPWLSGPIVIEKSGECVCSDADAKALMTVNPHMFTDLGELSENQPKLASARKAKAKGE